MLIVADTSALVALAECDALLFLEPLFGGVRVPAAVLRECTVPGKPHAPVLAEYLERRTEAIDLSEFIIAAPGLGAGELEAMALYKRLRANRLLVDDVRARRIAMLNEIAIIVSLGVLISAKSAGLLVAVKPRIQKMQSAGIHIGDHLLAEVLRLAEE